MPVNIIFMTVRGNIFSVPAWATAGIATSVAIKTARASVATNRYAMFADKNKSEVIKPNPLAQVLKDAKPTPGKPNQLETILEDGTKVIFRRDIGEHAHPIGKAYREPVDHYNIEVHTASPRRLGKFILEQNAHIILDKDLNPIEIILKNKSPINNPTNRPD